MKVTRSLLCVFALAFVRGAIAECPPAEVIRPCTCGRILYLDFVQCANFNDLASLQEVFDNSFDRPFDGFALNDSNVMYLSGSWLSKKQTQMLYVQRCSLSALFDEAPGTNNKISHINLFNVQILRGIEWEHFKPLQNLLDLVIQNVEIRKMRNSLAENVNPGLRKLRMKGTKTILLEDNVFQNLTALDWFELQDAQVTTLKRSMFANPSSLFVLDIRNNLVESLPDDMFTNMEQLEDVFLNGNKLVTLTAATFSDIYERFIYNLDVQDNPIVCDCSISWLVRSTRYVKVKGYCSAPENVKGRHLLQLKVDEFSYCPSAAHLD